MDGWALWQRGRPPPPPLTVKVMEAFGYGTSVRKWADNENDQDVFSASSF